MAPSLDELKSKTFWKKCSTCKAELPFGAAYYICSVSTCQGGRTGLHFCSVECWDAHLGFARHRRDAGALDAVAPTREAYLATLEETPAPEEKKQILVRSTAPTTPKKSLGEVETLVVVSKVKQLIRDLSAMSTSQCAIDAFTQKVVQECLKGIENAKVAGRKTVMGRDIK